jgi:hypothetical protein
VAEEFQTEPGVLYANTAQEMFRYATLEPAPELAPFVANYWTVSWDLRGRPPYAQHVLTRPGVNMTFKDGRSRIAGLTTGQFTEVLAGRHRVFGVRFRTGSFRSSSVRRSPRSPTATSGWPRCSASGRWISNLPCSARLTRSAWRR